MMTRSEAARRLGISRDRLARWEKARLAHPQRKGTKVSYTEEELARLQHALSTGQLVRAQPSARSAAQATPTRASAAQPSAQPAAQATSSLTLAAQPPAQPVILTGSVAQAPAQQTPSDASSVNDADDPSVRALHIQLAQVRLKKAVLEAEVETMRAQADHSSVAVSLREHERALRIVELAERFGASVPEHDRELAEELLTERLRLLDELDGWEPIAIAVRDEIEEAHARWEIARHHNDAQRTTQQRAAQASAAHAARAAQEAEIQAKAAEHAQLVANAQRRAQAIAHTVTTEAISLEDLSVEDANRLFRDVCNALGDLNGPAFYDDMKAFMHARRAVAEALAARTVWMPQY